ncbi:threonine/serine exporter family protein [Latilactobacillus curvatus]|uniref:threonine/serine exporter family protein n=1 Tax=Latilactobacillus curvatus TaxID=28038 RepID=UPI000B622934|nr:threonine/serine exporter family protein [Latilactobacillus curvatus]ASN62672.1 hypothetical protein CGZ47_09195 [Latilactobacillus curvatus]MCT2881083.1 threonine/serine exporter [Latilactobacillus curvatus]WRS46390.1 threonine/serine exporter family protein [Latilactobacillus curvatus]
MAYWLQFCIQAILSYVSTVAFGVCINVPRKAFLWCGIAGMAGWQVYWVLFNFGSGRMLANLLGALTVGICGNIMARYKRMPVIIFNIPGLVPLVPGGTAYRAIRNLVLGNLSEALSQGVSVIMIAGAIAVGFMLAQIMAEITRKKGITPKQVLHR